MEKLTSAVHIIAMMSAARMGLGLIQIPRYHAENDLTEGRLVRVLEEFPLTATPVSLLYPRNRQLSPRVRVFIDWLVKVFARQNPESAHH